MATTIDYERAAGRGGAPPRRIVASSGGDRTAAFRAARRHTRIVRTLRIALPASALLISVVYAVGVMQEAGWGANLPQLIVPRIIPENLAMRNPRYEGFNDDGGAYVVTAKSAAQVLTNFNLIKLETISGEFTDARKSVTHLNATRGTFDNKANRLELFDGIEINGDSGLKATLSKATVMTKDGTVVSKEPVRVEMPTGTINSEQMTYRNKSREMTFVGSVRTHLKPRAKPAGAAAAATEQATDNKLFGGSDAPMDITSSRLDIDDTNKTATFTGSVRAVQETTILTAPEIVVTYESTQPDGAAPKLDSGGSIKRIVAKGPVVIDQGPNDRVTADGMEFDAANEKAFLTGNVVMSSGDDRRATGDSAELDQRADTILLTGNVVVTQGRNELKGERLFVDRKASRTRMTAGATGGGRVAARFYQSGTGTAKPASPAESAAGALGMATFKTNPGAPIDIAATQLEVNDVAKTAVFSGDVRAEQGEITIDTSQLTAFYSGEAGASSLGDDAKGPAAQLKRIEARRKVVITSGKGQKATGDWADFDPKKHLATVGGDVVLTEGKNVVRGSRLDIDTTTGQSVIHASPDAVSASTPARSGAEAAAAAAAKTTRKRPSAVFYPKKANGSRKSKGSASSWDATTAPPSNGGN